MKTLQDRISATFARHPDWNDARVSNALNAPIAAVRAVRAGEPISGQETTASMPETNEMMGLVSLEKVIQKYDIRAAIERELAALPKGKLLEEGELCRRVVGTDRQRFRRAIENNPDTFRAHRIKLRLDEASEGKWFWASAEDISAALRMRDL